jgi:nucleotide-binding universal stress UspA family protein
MKALVGVDGSSNSFAAVEFAGRLLAPERDELVLLFATPALEADQEDLDPAVHKRARNVLSSAVLNAANERLPPGWQQKAKQKEVAGAAGEILLQEINRHGAELAVVGFRGTSSLWERFILGSVSRAVVHTAPIPVLVVKGTLEDDSNAPSAATASGMRVLVAYDGPQFAEPVVSLLRKFTWPAGCEGHVMTVVRPIWSNSAANCRHALPTRKRSFSRVARPSRS